MESNFQDFQEEEGGAPFDLKVLLLYGLFRSKVWVASLTAIGLFGGLLVGAAAPNEYQSEARLRYVPGERDRLTDDDLAGLESVDRRNAAPGLTDEIMLLENPIIYQRVAERLGPAVVLKAPDPEQYDGPSTSWPVRALHGLQKMLVSDGGDGAPPGSEKALKAAWHKLRADTSIGGVRNSATIRVLVRASSAERAQEFCTVMVDAFQERHREVFSAEARLDGQRQKVIEAREKYKGLEGNWNDYRETCGVFDYDQDRDANQEAMREVSRLQDLQEGARKKTMAQIKVYEQRLSEIKEFVEERVDAVQGENPEYGGLRTQKADLERQLLMLVEGAGLSAAKLAQQRTQFESQLRKVDEKLEQTEPTIQLLPARVERRKNPEYYDVQTGLLELRSERDGVIADLEYMAEKQDRLKAGRKRIAKCKDTHFEHRTLVEAASADLKHQQEQLAKLEKLALAEMHGASALKPMWDPTLPQSKIGPSRLKPLLAGLAGGVMLGLMLAVMRQLFDRRLRYPETLEKGLGLRVIGVVPEVRRLRALRGKGASSAA